MFEASHLARIGLKWSLRNRVSTGASRRTYQPLNFVLHPRFFLLFPAIFSQTPPLLPAFLQQPDRIREVYHRKQVFICLYLFPRNSCTYTRFRNAPPTCSSSREVRLIYFLLLQVGLQQQMPEIKPLMLTTDALSIDGRKERVQFDKITARVSRLCYGLDPEHVDAAAITQKVISGVYQGVTTVELDNLVGKSTFIALQC